VANGRNGGAVEFLYLGTELTNTVTNFSKCDLCKWKHQLDATIL